MTEVNCAEKRGPLGDRRIIYAIPRVPSFDEVSRIVDPPSQCTDLATTRCP